MIYDCQHTDLTERQTYRHEDHNTSHPSSVLNNDHNAYLQLSTGSVFTVDDGRFLMTFLSQPI